MITIFQTNYFAKSIKKLSKQDKQQLDIAVNNITKKPDIGIKKIGDLASVRVYKFKIKTRQMLLAYLFDEENQVLTLLALGSHENFYRDLKRHCS